MVTRWTDDASFRAWVDGAALGRGHAASGPAVATESALPEFEVVQL